MRSPVSKSRRRIRAPVDRFALAIGALAMLETARIGGEV